MTIKTLSFGLLVLNFSLLTGCAQNNVAIGTKERVVQVSGNGSKAAGEQQDVPSEAQRLEDLRIAKERADLAEKKAEVAQQEAELERQKREFAEGQLRQKNEDTSEEQNNSATNEASTYTPPHKSPRVNSSANYSNYPRTLRQQYVYNDKSDEDDGEDVNAEESDDVYEFSFEPYCRVPNVGETFCYNGELYAVISRQGNMVEAIIVTEN